MYYSHIDCKEIINLQAAPKKRQILLQKYRHSLFLWALSFIMIAAYATPMHAQRMNRAYQNYIQRFANEGIRQMKIHAVPASITIAQGLLESSAGTSELASIHHNHFGIKCHNTWQGKKTYKSDDRPNECFRSYDNDLDSYNDHSNFLKQPRYSALYQLKKGDYRGWAKGLQRCGYATDKGYANKLIAIIELYGLYELDHGRYPSWMNGKPSIIIREDEQNVLSTLKHEPFISYGLLYVIAENGDTYTSIAKEMEMKPQRVADYNDAPLDFPLSKGDIVYLQKKNRRATAEYTDHVVGIGESMHSISQRYGIRLSALYKMNDLDPEEYIPTEGDVLILR